MGKGRGRTTGMPDFTELDVLKLPETSDTPRMVKKTPFTPTPRTVVHRIPARASYDRALAYSILDEALFCVVAFVADGQPYAIPMAFARLDDSVILHGSTASRLLKLGQSGARVAVTVTLIDGLVLARSAMHHSLNYRSVMILGALTEIVSRDEKLKALARVVNHVLPNRSNSARPPNPKELAATRVLALPIEEASVKVRSGGPLDIAADLSYPCWAGVLPVGLAVFPPIPDATHPPLVPEPAELGRYFRGTPQ